MLWARRRYTSIHWTLLNHQFPLIFVLLPPVAGGLLLNVTLPEQAGPSQEITSGADAREVGGPVVDPETAQVRDAGDHSTALVSYVFYPTYYSLLVVVSAIFFDLQTEVEEWMKTLDKGDREANRWHAVSALCLLIGLFAALLYALPYIADIQGGYRGPQPPRYPLLPRPGVRPVSALDRDPDPDEAGRGPDQGDGGDQADGGDHLCLLTLS